MNKCRSNNALRHFGFVSIIFYLYTRTRLNACDHICFYKSNDNKLAEKVFVHFLELKLINKTEMGAYLKQKCKIREFYE